MGIESNEFCRRLLRAFRDVLAGRLRVLLDEPRKLEVPKVVVVIVVDMLSVLAGSKLAGEQEDKMRVQQSSGESNSTCRFRPYQ